MNFVLQWLYIATFLGTKLKQGISEPILSWYPLSFALLPGGWCFFSVSDDKSQFLAH